MTTWYVDYENGTNANASAGNGDSFATRRKTIDNCVAAAIAPGDTIRIMGSPAPTSIGNGTWTDGPLAIAVAISGSTNTTPITLSFSLSNWNTLNPAVGDTAIVNSHATNTNANGVWKISAIDSVNYKVTLVNADGSNSVGNGVGSGGYIRKVNNLVVTLATACTANIAECGNKNVKANWTASANVTCAKSTDYKEGGECQSIAIGAAFTTGMAAYVATGTLNLSGYQQVSFWVKQTSGTIGAAGATRLRLCTDTAGATPVHDVNIPALGALNQWVPVVVDLATNLNSAIQSINFDVVTDNGAQTFWVDNIFACKASSSADSLNLTSLISKDPGDHSYGDGYECWFGIQSINSTRVVLDGTVNSIPGSSPQRGYSGTTETVTTYKRETIKTVAVAASTTASQTYQDNGTLGSLITLSGGWNRTDMSTQTLETWFDGQNGLGICLQNARQYYRTDKVNGVRYYYVYNDGGTGDCEIGRLECASTSSTPINCTGSRLTATTLSAVCCGGAITPGTAAVVTTIGRADSTTIGNGVTLGTGSWTGTIKSACNNSSSGVASGAAGYIGEVTKANGNATSGYVGAQFSVAGSVTSNSNANGVSLAVVDTKILGGSTTGNSNGGVQISGSGPARITLRNFTINEATEVFNFVAHTDARCYSEKHDGTAGNNRIFCDGGLIATDATTVHGTASYSWKFSPTSTNRSQYYPLNLPIAQVAVGASALVTVSAWFLRSNSGLTGKLVCKGGQIAGVASDVVSQITFTPLVTSFASNASPIEVWTNTSHGLTTGDTVVIQGVTGNTAANGTWTITVTASNKFTLTGSTGNGSYITDGFVSKWEQLSLTFTPSESGVVEIEAQFYGGTTYNGWVSDSAISQA